MTIKKEYEVGDIVWIYGVSRQNRITKGSVIKKVNLDGFSELHYIISIPTEIEPLLEIRTWHTISQDEYGPIGSFRDLKLSNFDATNKFITRVGYTPVDELEDFDEPTAAEIHAAIEKSQKAATHGPLHIKENKPRRRNYPRKKKQ